MAAGTSVGVDPGHEYPVIDFPKEGPPSHSPELKKLVESIALDTYWREPPDMKIFFYVNNDLEIFSTDPLERAGPFTDWFDDYYAGHRTAWNESHVVVYSDTVEGADEIRYHVVIGDDLPVYALTVNRSTGQAQWYLQETATAASLAARK